MHRGAGTRPPSDPPPRRTLACPGHHCAGSPHCAPQAPTSSMIDGVCTPHRQYLSAAEALRTWRGPFRQAGICIMLIGPDIMHIQSACYRNLGCTCVCVPTHMWTSMTACSSVNGMQALVAGLTLPISLFICDCVRWILPVSLSSSG
jgi:hypothetical protein